MVKGGFCMFFTFISLLLIIILVNVLPYTIFFCILFIMIITYLLLKMCRLKKPK